MHRNSLLRWRNEEKYRVEIDKIVQVRCKFLDDRIKLKIDNLFEKALVMIEKSSFETVKTDLLKYLMDRGLEKASTKIEMTVAPNED